MWQEIPDVSKLVRASGTQENEIEKKKKGGGEV